MDRFKTRLRKQELLHNTKYVSHRPGEERMSEVLMEFVDPYTVHAGTEEQWRKLLGVAVIAWNASMFPPGERKRMVDEQINHKVTR